MDDTDRASQLEDSQRRASIAAARAKAQLPYTGQCYSCGTGLPQPLRFCDEDCRDDYEREARMRQIRGR